MIDTHFPFQQKPTTLCKTISNPSTTIQHILIKIRNSGPLTNDAGRAHPEPKPCQLPRCKGTPARDICVGRLAGMVGFVTERSEWEVPLHHMAQERQVGFADEQLPRPVV
ncbi:hypothetical protein IFM61606_05062 [Aspergillus udagawae]|nr:hypothetical protein IFM5058_06086 [Aspergillus udagawae]GFG25131.1 hypothetical protein IFM61606_05062 [Aspergillus udagawae]